MAKKIIKAQMKQRLDTKANWASQNPVLLAGELGIVSDDPNLYKVGDGTTAWNALPFRGFDGTLVHTTGDSKTTAMSQMGVTEACIALENRIMAEDKHLAFDNTGYFHNAHSLDPTTNAQNTGYVPVKGYVKIQCNCSISYVGYAIAFFDADKTFISGILGESGNNVFNYEAAVPENAYYVIVSNYGTYKPSATVYAGDTLAKKLEDAVLKSTASTYADDSGNLFDKSKVTLGKEVYGNGALSTESQSAASDFIFIGDAKILFFNNLPEYTGFNRYCAFYTADKEFINLRHISPSVRQAVVSAFDGAAYCRFSLYQRWTSGSKDFEATTVSFIRFLDYAPINEYLSKIGGFNIPKISIDVLANTRGKKALIFGDSITETASISDDGATYTEGARLNWPSFALPLLRISSFKNYAKSGATYKDASGGSTRQDLSEQINMAIKDSANDDANIIIMALGTNDGAANIGSYDAAMSKTTLDSLDRGNLYEALRWAMWTLRAKYPNAKFFVGLPIQRTDREQPEDLLTAIKKMAHRYNFIIIDATNKSGIVRDFEVAGANGLFLSDGLHPNAAGSEKLGALYANEILASCIL